MPDDPPRQDRRSRLGARSRLQPEDAARACELPTAIVRRARRALRSLATHYPGVAPAVGDPADQVVPFLAISQRRRTENCASGAQFANKLRRQLLVFAARKD